MINTSPPGLEDLTWRPITRDDEAAVVELASTCFTSDGGLHFLYEPESIISRYFPSTPWIGMGAFTSSKLLVACSTVSLGEDADKRRGTIVGQVRPGWRGKGIGTALIHWSQGQSRSLIANDEIASASTNRWLRNDSFLASDEIATESLTEPARHLYQTHGFKCVTESLIMRRDLHLPIPENSFPPDITITNWQSDLIDQFFQAYDGAFRERPGFPGWTVAEWIDWWTTDDFRPEWSLLARSGDQPVGFLNASANPPHGFVMQVGVIPTQRRRGIGSGLILETMHRMRAAGMASTQLTVNINNPGAIQTYVDLGYETIGRRARFEKMMRQNVGAG
jgi:mycothiol synthase